MTIRQSVFGTACVVIVLLATLGLAAGQTPREPQATGAIVGCVTAKDGRVLGGARILITGPVVRALIVDPKGCFAFTSLAPGAYSVSADWPGYVTATSAPIRVASGNQTRVDLVLPSSNGPIGFLDSRGTDPFTPRRGKVEDIIVHLRVQDTLPGRELGHGVTSYLIVAQVLTVVTAHERAGVVGDTLRFYQIGSTFDLPYRFGDEFVAFLRVDDQNAFIRAAGSGSMFQVRDGSVVFHSSIISGVQTWKVEDFITKIKETR